MKSVFNKIEKETYKDIVFPVLAEFVNGDSFVVLFFNNTKGIVVKGNLYNNVGDYDETFSNVTYKKYWRIIYPEEYIMLSND